MSNDYRVVFLDVNKSVKESVLMMIIPTIKLLVLNWLRMRWLWWLKYQRGQGL